METDRDRFPNIRDAIDTVLESEDFPEGDVERIEITCFASGDFAYRVWTPRAEEPIGGSWLADTT